MNLNKFSITYWIRKNQNPKWSDKESSINFNPMFLPNGILIATRKIEKKYLIYLLSPELGNLKIETPVNDYLKDDFFVVITRNENEIKLYFNAIFINLYKISEIIIKDYKIDDYVMLKITNGDLDNFKTDLETFMPAIIENIYSNNYTFFLWQMNQRIVLNKNRILSK
ncbi:MAG: hypothetical protein K8S23_00675 [Candidatus Cloacimonetes bacterium]|nr:hypothetical protein [Candidatus Cloacimonadota bacterium]